VGIRFEVVDGQVVRVGGPPSKAEEARVRRNRRALAESKPVVVEETLEAPPADFAGTAEDYARFKREVRRRVNGREVTEEEFRVSRETKREELDANLQGIIESKKFPGIKGDDTTFNNATRYSDLVKRYGEKKVKRMMAKARKAGVPVGPDWTYDAGLATGAESPDGWIAPTETRGDIKRRIRKSGGVCEDFGVKARPLEKDPHERVHRLAPDLVNEQVVQKLRADGDLLARVKEKPRKIRELKEAVIDKHGAKGK